MTLVSNGELKKIEPFNCDTDHDKHNEPERKRHVHIRCHWNLPIRAFGKNLNAHRNDKM
jgi:hypothetical protein